MGERGSRRANGRQRKTKKRKSVRFKEIVYVYNHPPIPLVDPEDSDVPEPATHTEDSDVTGPALHKEESHVAEPATHTEDSHVTGPALHKEESHVAEPATHTEDSHVTGPEMQTEDSQVTEPAIQTEDSHGTGPEMQTEDGQVTEPEIQTEDNHETEPEKHVEVRVTIPAMLTEDGLVTIPTIFTKDGQVIIPARHIKDSEVTEPAMDTEEGTVTKLALDITRSAITAAVKTIEEPDYTIKNVNWLTHGEFTPEKGRQQIEEFVLTWEYQDRWVHYTKLVETRDVVHSFHYIYSVRWSVPTAQTPTALGSTFAFFTVKFNKNKPPDAPIEVSYKFEGQSLVHRPGMSRFRERWVREMVEAKYMLMKSLPF